MRDANGIVAYLTDVGTRDPYAGSVKGATLSECRDVKLVDITHNVRSFDIDEAALTLLLTYKYFPPGTVFVAVVVPGVGPSEEPVLVVSKNYFFVGPNNGVLAPAATDDGVEEVIMLNTAPRFKEGVAGTFHGRDVYAPVAAMLACGTQPTKLGECVGAESLAPLPEAHASSRDDVADDAGRGYCVGLTAIHVDKYGNIMFSEPFSTVVGLGVKAGDKVVVTASEVTEQAVIAKSFTDVGRGTLILYENSYGLTELAIKEGSAQQALGIKVPSTARVCREDSPEPTTG